MKISRTASEAIPDFELKIAHHAEEMRNWRAHMKRVKEDEEAGVTGIDKHSPYPRPVAPDLVDAAVDEDGNPNYEFVEDGPTPEQILQAKKDLLFAAVSEAEAAAKNTILPPKGRRRLLQLQAAEIMSSEERDLLKLKKSRGLVGKVAEVVGLKNSADEIVRKRDERAAKFLEEQADRAQKLSSIERAAAEACDAIEDLTLDTIDAWKIPDLI